jgi:V8-like Glu-specific endopeptidase
VRRSHTTRHAAAALAALGALLATALPAGTATAASPPAAVHEAATTAAAQERVTDFWTPERMRAAEPLDLLEAGRTADAGAAATRGEHRTVPPTAPEDTAPGVRAFPEPGGPWAGGGEVVATSGRVFFTYDGRTASCSGNAVSSDNGSTVLTAGHCVKMGGTWHTDWIFVPGYDNGEAPYGEWTAAATLTTPQWEATEDINFDVGAAVVNPLDGAELTDVVGGQGLAFNTGYDIDMWAFGFPAADPYDGTALIHCSGRAYKDFLLSSDHGLTCDMTGGASGGPWFTSFDATTGLGLQSSVNSFKYVFMPDAMFGPYFGAEAQALYEEAQAS